MSQVPQRPVTQKPAKAKRDPEYLARVRELPCCVCEALGDRQVGPTYAHHVIHFRFSQQKTPDRDAIPLCFAHHQGPEGIHADKTAWREMYGPDNSYIKATKRRLA